MADTKNIQIVLEGKNQTAAAFKDAERSLSGFTSKVEAMQPAFQTLAVAGTVAFAALSAGIYKAVTAAGTLEQADIAFTTMLGSGEKAKQLLKDLSDFAQKTPFELTGIRQTAKQLLAFGISSNDMIPTLKMLGDVASGVSVPIEQVAYAYGQVRTANQLYGTELRQFMNAGIPILDELARMYGVTASEAKKMTEEGKISFGDVEKAFQNMTGEGGKFFNLMDAQSGSFLGKMSNLSDTISKFMETAGKPLLEQFKPIVEKLIQIVTVIGEWVAKNPKLAANLILLATVTAGLVAVVGTLGVAFAGFTAIAGILGVSLGVLAGIFLGIPIAIAAIVAAGYMIITNWDLIKTKIIEVWESISDSVKTAASVILAVMFPVIAIGILVVKHWEEIKAAAFAVWGEISAFFSATWGAIKQVFEIAIALIVGLTVLAFQKMGIDIVAVVKEIIAFFQVSWEFLKNYFVTGLDTLVSTWTARWNTIKLVATSVWEAIKAVAMAAWTFLINYIKASIEPFASAFTAVWDRAKAITTSAWEGIKGVVTSNINFLIDKINKFISSVNSAASSAAGAFGISAPQIPNIPKLANGGIVTKPTLALIGEAGAEAVVPLTKSNNPLAGNGGGITINFTGNTFMGEEEVAEKIGNSIIDQLKLNSRFVN